MAFLAVDPKPTNIIFFGEVGSGKSYAINLLLGDNVALVSNDSRPCTQVNAFYKATLGGREFTLWDTRGLGEARNIFQTIFGGGSQKDLKKFLKERHQEQQIDLLVFCVHGPRAIKAQVKYYKDFCAITRRLAAPVAIMVTLEREKDAEGWWTRNAHRFEELEMRFDGHICVTRVAEPQLAVSSRQSLINLISKKYCWTPEDGGSYFGSRVQKPTSLPPVRRKLLNIFTGRNRINVDIQDYDPRQRNDSHLSTTTSSYYTAPSPVENPIVPPTPSSPLNPTHPSRNETRFLPPAQKSPCDDIPTTPSSSTFYASSCTLHSDVQLTPCTEEEACLNGLPFKRSTATVRRRKAFAVQGGSFGDVWECDLISGGISRMVAVKAVKANGDLTPHLKKLRRELRIWGTLQQHKNVVPLLGVVSGFGPLLSMVSPWFSNGSLSSYITAHKMLKLTERCRLLGDVASGLGYIHSQRVIHGDLHSGNVLVNDDGTACLTDFGLSFADDFVGTSYLKSSICGGARFADPALVQRVNNSRDSESDVICPTKPCDVYSFGGIMLHVLSGKVPYDEIRTPSKVLLTVLDGNRPRIPPDISSLHASVIRKCWDDEERERPSADQLARMFDGGGAASEGSSSW